MLYRKAEFIWQMYMGRVKRKSAFEHEPKCEDLDYPAHAQGIIRVCALHSMIQ